MDTESRFISIDSGQQCEEENVIAEGSTSVCYKIRYDGKWYSKKQLKPEYKDSPTYQETLKKEYALGSRLNNPYIIHYEDIGEDDKGLFILTDFIEGKPLSDFIADAPGYFRSRSARRQFIDEILSAVDCLHRHQILHLDLKPDNIMITDIGHHVKLIDCGFAYQDCFTQTPGGSEGYSAPEQFSGKYKIGTYSDIYALGKIFDEMHVTGKKVISRCLKEDPSKRYQSVSELRHAITDRRKTYALITILILIAATSVWGYNTYKHRKIPNRYSKYIMQIDSTNKMKVTTLVPNANTQPPLVGGYIENFDSAEIINKGLLVATDSDDLFKTDTASASRFGIYDDKTMIFGTRRIKDDMQDIVCSLINKEEFVFPLMHLMGDKDYYVKAYVITRQRKYVYGETKHIHSKDFDRFDGGLDVANVFHASDHSVFDIMTDELIDLKKNGCFYTSNEAPRECIRNTSAKKDTYYKLKTRWNYQLWYSYWGINCLVWKSYDKAVRLPFMTFRDGKLYISKDITNADDDITFYYTINGDWQRPEHFRLRYSGPISINRPCIVTCYGKRKDGAISFTNSYVVMKEMIK